MDKKQHNHDVVIIGSGLGGLLCAYLLAERGYDVCVLEKNVQFGGCLQVFARDKAIFDTGVHYIGELDKGQNLYQVFSYFGLIEKLQLEQLDRDAFDVISFRGESVTYPLAQGHDNFVRELSKHFPGEEYAIRTYVEKLRSINEEFYSGDFEQLSLESMQTEAMQTSAKEFIASLTQNLRLRDVLAGNIPLYAGVGDSTPLHQHALIVNSYLKSAWRCLDGGAQIAKHLTSAIREMGGTLRRRCQVVELEVEDGFLTKATTAKGEVYTAKKFVANIPPENVVDMLRGTQWRKTYLRRLTEPTPTASFFALYLRFKPEAFPYYKQNFYHYNRPEVWSAVDYNPENWPESWLFYPAMAENGFMKTATILAYMKFGEVAKWADSHNTTAHPESRGLDYEAFKREKAETLLADVEKRFPGFGESIQSFHTSTPLTYRDYLGTTNGAVYGKVKDYRKPEQAFISPRSKTDNLYFAGQHVHLHGIKGVATTAILTVAEMLDNPELYAQIKRGDHPSNDKKS